MRIQELLQVKQHSLLMTGPLVTASLQDQKIQTRRVIAWSNSYVDGEISKFWREHWHELDFSKAWPDDGPSPAGNQGPYLHVPFPPEGTVHRVYPRIWIGDLIWIKETWGIQGSSCVGKGTQREFFNAPQLQKYTNDYWKKVVGYKATGDLCQRWWPSIYMPKWAARLWLIVKKVRPERLQRINPVDVCREGIRPTIPGGFEIEECHWIGEQQFRPVWDSINGKRYPWESNPMVWVYEYERKS